MKKHVFTFLMLLSMVAGVANCQIVDSYNLGPDIHNTVMPLNNGAVRLFDIGGSGGNYTNGEDYWVTISSTCDTPVVMTFTLDLLNLRFTNAGLPCGDTLFVYDGPTINDSLLWYATGSMYVPNTRRIYQSPNNTTGMMTLRLKACDCSGVDRTTGAGFNIMAECTSPCETFSPVIDSIFYKTRDGEIYEFGRVKLLYDVDTIMVWDSILMDSVAALDSTPFKALRFNIPSTNALPLLKV